MLKSGRRTIPALCLLAAGVIAAGVYLAPSHQEMALMQMDDLHFSNAFKNFSLLHKDGDRSINVLAPLVNLNIYYGDVDKAIALLKSYIAENPQSVEGRKKLASLYKGSQRFDHYCAVLEELQQLSPSAATLHDLVETYAFLGRSRDEMNALAKLIHSKGYQPEESDYYKLAVFYRVDHQTDDAVRVIRDYIDDKNYKVSVDTVFLAIELLQEEDEENKALSLARIYLRKQGKEDDAIMFSAQFEAYGQLDSAYTVLEPYLDNIGHSTDLEQQLVDVLMEQKKDDEVYTLLSTQRAKEGVLPPSLAVSLTDLAVKRADYDMIEALIRSQDLNKMSESALLRYADMSFRLKRPDLAKIMLARLNAEYMHQSPALAAILQVAADDTPKSMAALATLPKDLSPEAKIVLSALYLQHSQPQPAFALLDNLPIEDIFDAFDATQYAELYLDVNAAAKAEQILDTARATATPEIQDSIDQILILLAAGEGKTDFVKDKLAGYAGKENDLWPDAFDLASTYHHDELALAIAEHLYKTTPTDENRLQLAEAFTILHRYPEALNHLQVMAPKNAEAREMYLDVIATWGQQAGGMQGLSEQQRAGLNAAVAAAMKTLNMSVDERHDLAYILEDIGFFEQAETVLVSLAGGQPYGAPDVEDLLGFWEDHPSPAGVAWVEGRARTSGGADEVAWLNYLNDNGHSQTVLEILHDGSDLSPPLADQYIEALVETQNKQKLEDILTESIETETNPARLKRLTQTATDEDVTAAAEKGWHKIYAADPDDSEALKELGLIDYDNGNYEEAGPLLKQYLDLDHDQAGYRVNYAYGEILQQQDRKSEADPYYRRALQQLSDITDKDPATRLDEAYLLYLTDHITESLTLFRQLYAKYPDDKELRADLAEVLTETGRFDEATALLSQ